nr:rod shape-determining protein MreD [Motilibacter aurantiacus]
MPRVGLAALLLLCASVLELAALAPLGLPGSTPDVVLLVVVALALRWGPLDGAVVGFAAGLLLDLAPPSDGGAGRWAAVFLLLGYAVGRLFEDADDTPVVALFAVTLASAASVLGYAALAALVGDEGVDWPRVPGLMTSSVIYDVVLTAVVVPVVGGLARRIDPEPDFRR